MRVCVREPLPIDVDSWETLHKQPTNTLILFVMSHPDEPVRLILGQQIFLLQSTE